MVNCTQSDFSLKQYKYENRKISDIDGAIGSDYLVVLKDANIQQSAKNLIREE